MWAQLQAYTFTSDGKQRAVNHLNEWGGFSKKIGMPVFTAWRDHTTFDRVNRTVTAVVSDTNWPSVVGVNNQERWLKYAEANDGIAAFFIIHAADENADRRKVKYIDDDAVYVGNIVRTGSQAMIVGKKQPLA
jgi:hypothetical protein